jgi:hypothetical protein
MWIEFATSDNKKVTAEYFGGEYVELYFDDQEAPSDVINVWDYEKGAPAQVIESTLDLARIVWDWVSEVAAEDPRWYENYLDN